MVRALESEVKRLKDENSEINALRQSNRLMEAELNKIRSEIHLYEEIADNRASEVFRLQHRGFWARVFNR